MNRFLEEYLTRISRSNFPPVDKHVQKALEREREAGLDPKWREDSTILRWEIGYGRNFSSVLPPFRIFMRWLSSTETQFKGFSPSDLVANQKKKGYTWDIVDVIQMWVRQLVKSNGEEMTRTTKMNYYSTIRSFFKLNRVPLPLVGFHRTITSTYLPPESELSVDEFKQIMYVSSRMYHAIRMTMFQGQWTLHGLMPGTKLDMTN